MSIDDAFNKDEGFEELQYISLFGKEQRPHCYYNGKLQYRTKDDMKCHSYCSLSDDKCPYYKMDKNKEYCTVKYNIISPKKRGF